jgi:hypothetical protein
MTPQLLKHFCAPSDEPREWIRAPFALDGELWATDGRVLVHCYQPAEPGTPEAPESAQKAIREYIMVDKVKGNGLALPKLNPCPVCNGSAELPCPTCGKNGECAACFGSGKLAAVEISQPCGEAFLSNRYAALLSRLPDVRLFPLGLIDQIRFTFTGGEGVVMPMMK